MTKARAASLALVTPVSSAFDANPSVGDLLSASRGSDRRVHARLTPFDLPLTARLKYGEAVTLVDLSVGGALVETSKILRPDTDLVLEILDSRTNDMTPVVSRVLRSQVAGLQGGITYRSACAFKRPLSHPALVAPPPLLKTDASDFLKLEFALKTIVEGYFKRPTASGGAGRWRDASALLDALVRLRAAAERRENPTDRQLAQLLATIIPALQRRDPVESMMGQLQEQLGQHLPVLAIHTNGHGSSPAHDRERVTLNMCTEPDQAPVAVTAEFAAGFGLDESQFRLLKASAYLVGLVENWHPPTPEPTPAPPPTVLIGHRAAAHSGSTVEGRVLCQGPAGQSRSRGRQHVRPQSACSQSRGHLPRRRGDDRVNPELQAERPGVLSASRQCAGQQYPYLRGDAGDSAHAVRLVAFGRRRLERLR
jgi:hypothetical protein